MIPIMDIDSITESDGQYDPISGSITIHLHTIYLHACKNHDDTDIYLIAKVITTILHEELHALIDYCMTPHQKTKDHEEPETNKEEDHFIMDKLRKMELR